MRDLEFRVLKECGEIVHPDKIDDETSHENCQCIHAGEPNASNNLELVFL